MRQSSSSSKPITSPGRALVEKFPPPLMRFLRHNVGSKSSRAKSKSKTKASPLFFRKKKPTGETQEPSSPKVTCIGQVRVRRSKNGRSRHRPRPEKPDKNRCGFSRKCLCPCPCPRVTFDTKGPRFLWARKWVSFFCCGPAKVRTESSNRIEDREEGETEERENVAREGSVSVSVSSEFAVGRAASEMTPPKNALLLTRCRSAPYRSSSLACRLWGTEEEEVEERENRAQKTEEKERERTTVSVSVSIASSGTDGRRDSASESPRPSIEEKEEEEEEKAVTVAPPLMALAMMRCRSEPARRESERLDPLTSEFWRERRLSNTDSYCKPHALLS